MAIGMFFETLGIGLIIPVLTIMTTPTFLENAELLSLLPARLNDISHEQLIAFGMIALLSVFISKAIFMAYMTWKQARFTCGIQAYISQKLFSNYMFKSYEFHLQNNSAHLIRNVITEVAMLGTVVQAVLVFMSEILIILGITLLLLYIETLGTIIVITILVLSSALFSILTKKPLLTWGEARQHHEGARVKHIQQGLGGAKDAKLLGREDNFIQQYEFHNYASAHVGERVVTINALPRLWLELLAAIGLVALVLILLGEKKSSTELLPVLGMFAGAAFRVMPSANRILNSLQQIRFNYPVIELLDSELEEKTAEVNNNINLNEITFKQELVFNDVSYTYPNCQSPALTEINLSIRPGMMVGFIGTTGAGKSTLIDVFLGLLSPDKGQVQADGINIESNIRCWQNKIGYVPQSIFLTDDTLRKNIAFGLPDGGIDESLLNIAIKAAQLDNFIAELPKKLNTIIGERGVRLSGGQKQRIGIARALYHQPDILVLDEATSALDTATEKKIMNEIDLFKGNKTIIIIAHRLSTIEKCDVVYRLENGMLVN